MVFISYSREDVETVKAISDGLTQVGWQVWMDVNSIIGGDLWRDSIAQAIANSEVLLLNVSPSACSSDYVRKEVFYAIRQGKPIVPVMVTQSKSVELPYSLELELGHLHFLHWHFDGINKITNALQALNKAPKKPAEDLALLEVKNLLDSNHAQLISLGKDFIAFRRLIKHDPEMAILRALRIIIRSTAYILEALKLPLQSDDINIQTEMVLNELKKMEYLKENDFEHISSIIKYSKKISVEAFLNSSQLSPVNEITSEVVAGCVLPMMGLLIIVQNLFNNTKTTYDFSGKLEVIKGSNASRDILQQAFLVGQRTYGVDIMSDFTVMEKMHATNPNIYNFLVETSTGMCIGYTSIVPLDKGGLESTLRPDFQHIKCEDIITFTFPGFYFVHLSSIAVDPAYRDLSKAFSILLNAYLEDLLKLSNQDIYIVGMSADAITTNGHRICQSLGLTPVVKRHGESTLFYGSLLPPELRFSSKIGLQLLKKYEEAYKSFSDYCPKIILPI